MGSRLEKPIGNPRQALREGRPLSVSDQRLLAGLASAESRIIGSAQLGKMRDAAIGLLRVTTLLAAVLLPALTDSSPDAVQSTEPRVAVIPVYGSQQDAGSGDAEPVTVNIKVESMGGVVEPDNTQIVIIEHKPLRLPKTGKVVLGSGPGKYWYRTELGEGDYFWALPDGDFSFRVANTSTCGSQDMCAQLEFEFDTRTGTQTRVGAVPPLASAAVPSDTVVEDCGDEGVPTRFLRCRHKDSVRELVVDVVVSRIPAEEDDKTAFLVRWCEVGAQNCPPDLIEPIEPANR